MTTDHETDNGKPPVEDEIPVVEPRTEQRTAPQPPQIGQPEREQVEIDIEKYLGEMTGRGNKVSLYRRSPMWCSGFCDQYPLDDQIRLEDIRDTWGGRRFELRILSNKGIYISSRHVTIADIPRHRGRPLDDTMHYARGGQEVIRNPAAETADKALQALQQSQERNQDLMMKFFTMQQKNAIAATQSAQLPVPAPSDPASQLSNTFELFKMMKDFAKDAVQGEEGTDASNASQYLEIAKMFKGEMDERRANAPQQKQKTIHLPKSKVVSRPVAAVPQVQPGEPEPDPEAIDEEEGPTLADELFEAGPEVAASILADAFERWTPEERSAAIARFSGQAGPDGSVETPVDEESTYRDNSPEVENGNQEENQEENHEEAS